VNGGDLMLVGGLMMFVGGIIFVVAMTSGRGR
jgi:hypothetical protein